MKFLATWSIDQDNWIPILQKWSAMSAQERADVGQGVKLVGRWHDMAARQGVAIFEATDAAALSRYIGQWNPFMEVDVAPVVDDEESAAIAQSLVREVQMA